MLALLVVTVTAPSYAIAPNVSLIPNGSFGGCNTCHENGGGTPRNAFGQDWDTNSDWAVLAGLDSDGDGCSNGAELGDPDGVWTPGDDPEGEAVSLPGDASDVACSVPGDTADPLPADSDDEDDESQGCATVSAGLPASAVLFSLVAMAGLGRRRRS